MATNNPPKPTIYTALSLVPDVSIDDTDVPDSVTTIESWGMLYRLISHKLF